MANISLDIAWKELKIAQIVQGNMLFQLLNLVGIKGHVFYELSRLLMMKNVSKDSATLRPNGLPLYRKG